MREGDDAASYEIAPGEITLGRSPSCNVVVEAERVSKVHARIERTRDQLLLEDLASANGTFVNGTRVRTAFLNAGDVVALAGDEAFRVDLQLAEVGVASGRHSATLEREARKQRFSDHWKTRLAWSEDERDELSDLRKRIDAYDKRRAAARPAAPPALPKAAPPKAAPPKAAPPQATPPQPVPPKAQAPDVAAPKAAAPVPPPSPTAASVKAAAPPAAPPPVPKSAPPPRAAAASATPPLAAPPTATPKPAPPPAKAEPPAAPVVAKPVPLIRELRLRAEGVDLAVTEPGEYELGRTPGLPLQVDHPTVSRHHARIILSEDRTTAYLQDQGGMNKTRLNGRPLQKISPLADGDEVRLGEVALVVRITRG